MKYAKLYIPILLLLIAKFSIPPLFSSKELGSKNAPIRFLLTPSVDAQKIAGSADKLVQFLMQETGYSFSASFPTSYIAVVEALGAERADFACMNTFSYVLAREKYGAEAVLRVIRRDGELTYKGQFIARANSGISSLHDIHGKRIAYVDPASTSGYILPKALLQKQNVVPGEEVFGMRHDNVVTMVYQGQVDVGATYYSPPDKTTKEILDARMRVKSQYPDIFDAVNIIGFTEEIPNDPWVFRKNFPKDMQKKIIAALLKFQQTPDGKTALYETYSVEGLAVAKDSDYDDLRKLISQFVGNIEQTLKAK